MPFDGVLTSREDRLADRTAYWRSLLAFNPRLRATIDFETRATCDLGKHGSWRYSRHHQTEAMCLSYRLPGQDVMLWHMAMPKHLITQSPDPLDLFAFILAGGLVEAHNAFFERMIWKHIMVPRHGWPEVPHLQWRCSAAKACAASLPRDLERATMAMHLRERKDVEGAALMKKMCKPRAILKAEVVAWMEANGVTGDWRRHKARASDALGPLWHEEEEDLYRLWEYNKQDVVAEEGLSDALPDLSDEELELWQLDQLLNERGVRFDLDMARAALELADLYKAKLNEELRVMTGISAGTKRAQVKKWLLDHEGVRLPDTSGDTVDWYLKNREVSGRARTVMRILVAVNRTSTQKYQAMLNYADPEDGRVRDLLMYHGAHTGRWTGKGVQVHNFPARDLCIKDFEDAADLIKSLDVDWCVFLYDDVMMLISHALRGAIIPQDSMDLMVADYSAIEARVVLWLADAKGALDVFRRGEDIYCDMASGIYGYRVLKDKHKTERQFGKQSILGLGYGMGFVTFLLTCRKYDIVFSREDVVRIMGEDELIRQERWVRDYLCMDPEVSPGGTPTYDAAGKRQAARVVRRLLDARLRPEAVIHELALMRFTVNVYRQRYPQVKDMWKDQEAAAIQAVTDWQNAVEVAQKRSRKAWLETGRGVGSDMPWDRPAFYNAIEGPTVQCGKVSWFVRDGWLHCQLPSCRPIRYRDPRVRMQRTSWGEMRPQLSYMHINGTTKKWERTGTYGGKLVENITQAVARDILANAMLHAYKGGIYFAIMSVHDELVCEVEKNRGSREDFEELMSRIPPWARGCPITAEAERLHRYKK